MMESSPVPSQQSPLTTPLFSPLGEDTYPAMPDDELFIRKAFETNPSKGYELLFRRYYQPLCSHAARFVYSREMAEDIVSDILCLFWQRQLYRQITTSYRAYLFTAVRHQAFAILRVEFRRETLEDTTPDSSTMDGQSSAVQSPYQLLQYHELSHRIDQIIQSLSPQSQKVFLMSRYEGRKNAAIAEELQISIKTVEGHITKVLTLLRKLLREDWLLSMLFLFEIFHLARG